MQPKKPSERLQRLFGENPEIEQLRIDEKKHNLEVGFAEAVPPASVLERIDANLQRELPNPEVLIHPSSGCHPREHGEPPFHHHHLGAGLLEFHRAHQAASQRVFWRSFPMPRWQNRTPSTAGPDYRAMLTLAAGCGLSGLAWHFAVEAAWSPLVCWLLLAVSYVCGAWHAAREVFAEIREGKIDVHFLMLVVAAGALFVNAAAEGATLLFLFSLSGGLEQFAHHRTQKSISSLLKAAPKQAWRREQGAWREIEVGQVQVGDELLVKPGELFPVDGTVLEGSTSVDESALTGEAIPVAKKAWETVSGGTLNLEGQAVVRVDRAPRESAVQRILAMIESAQQQKAPAQRFTDSFSRYYTWAVLAMSALQLIILLTVGRPWNEAFYRTMTLLVVASPCALVLSIPAAVLVAIASGARQGVLFRGGTAVENLAGVTQFAFDKTGTLTKGKLKVAHIIPFHGAAETEVLRLAASLGQASTHPLSRAIVAEADRRGLVLAPVADFQNVAGLGLRAIYHAETILVGNRALLVQAGVAIPEITVEHANVEVWVATSQVLGVIHLSDELRPEAKPTIEQLRRDGMAVALLTGDRATVAQEIAAALGIDEVRASMRPADKLACVHRWQAEGRKVAMVGDGINDAPSLTAADVAIAMGARGSDAALEQADVVLMHDKIENVSVALALSRKARSIIRQNLVISLGVVVVLMISALSNRIGLSLGVVGHEGSTVAVVLNGLRLLSFRKGRR